MDKECLELHVGPCRGADENILKFGCIMYVYLYIPLADLPKSHCYLTAFAMLLQDTNKLSTGLPWFLVISKNLSSTFL